MAPESGTVTYTGELTAWKDLLNLLAVSLDVQNFALIGLLKWVLNWSASWVKSTGEPIRRDSIYVIEFRINNSLTEAACSMSLSGKQIWINYEWPNGSPSELDQPIFADLNHRFSKRIENGRVDVFGEWIGEWIGLNLLLRWDRLKRVVWKQFKAISSRTLFMRRFTACNCRITKLKI